MEVKSYDCRTCGELINFGGEKLAVCQICGTENELVNQQVLNEEAVKELEHTFGSKLNDLQSQINVLKHVIDDHSLGFSIKRD